MGIKKVLVSGIPAGIAMWVVSFLVDAVIQVLWAFDIFSIPGIRSVNDPLMVLFLLYPILFGIIMAAVYHAVKPLLKGSWMKNGQQFGVMVWLLNGFTSGFIVFSSMNYPFGFNVSAFLGSFVSILAGSLVLAKMNR